MASSRCPDCGCTDPTSAIPMCHNVGCPRLSRASRLRRDVDDTDAGAVPGCTTECAKMREELKEAWDAAAEWELEAIENAAGEKHALELVASLRADAEAVRAVEEWKGTVTRNVDLRGVRQWCAVESAQLVAYAPDLPTLGRALMARRQEEGQTDNG